ncbi:sugar-binding domain-containing protein [Vibrio diabolicus]|uniref:sugar-binding domain-containing protein n=1 Tax=Vibrio diabolicus TaxID=50719 RepID=UPI00387E5CF5
MTHVIYAFLSMCGPHAGASETVQKLVAEQCEGKDPYTAIIVDTEAALEKDFGDVSVNVPYKGHFAQLAEMKKQHPDLKILPSFGGWTMSEPFHAMAKSKQAMDQFSKTAVKLIAQYDFFDIHGNVANTVMSDRVIGLGIEEFRPISEVIAIAAENSKPLALLGALRTGAIDVIATSVSNALTVLNLDEQMHGNAASES